jgi:hypothetical protein
VTTIKTDPPPLSVADYDTASYTSGPNIMHRDHSAWVREAVGEGGRVRAALLPPFWSSNDGRVVVVIGVSVDVDDDLETGGRWQATNSTLTAISLNTTIN